MPGHGLGESAEYDVVAGTDLITNEPPGAEYTINRAAVCFVLLRFGPGVCSLDALIF